MKKIWKILSLSLVLVNSSKYYMLMEKQGKGIKQNSLFKKRSSLIVPWDVFLILKDIEIDILLLEKKSWYVY